MSDPTPPEPLTQLNARNYSARIVRQKMWRRMNVENQHFMGAVVGREGTGKSHSALTLARTVDPDFTAEDVFFDPQELLEAFDSDDYSAGNVIVLDEAGVGLGNRSWYEKEQILLNQTLQTVRDDNMGVLFTLPRLEELDSQTIGRLHAFIEMLDVHPDEGWAAAKWKNINLTRDGRGKTYKKYTRLRVGGVKKRITRFAVLAPPEELVDGYEERKEAFKRELYEDAIAAYDDEEEEANLEPSEVADKIVDDGVSDYVSEHGGNGRRYVDQELIRADFGLSHRDAKATKKIIERTADVGSQNTSAQ
jgi:ABC-type dipeptide/oligopeptide/nickel transport system ATPase component